MSFRDKVKGGSSRTIGKDLKTQVQLHMMLVPGAMIMLAFSIVPLFGILIAFKDYKAAMGFAGIFTAPWNNFAHFKQIFRSP